MFTEKSGFYRGGAHRKLIYRGGLPKKGGLDNLQIKGGAWKISRFKGELGKKKGVLFLRGG